MKKNSCLLTGFLLLSLAFAPAALAANGKWNVNAAGSWATASNWTNSQIADGIGSIANIEFNITADRIVTLNQVATVGTLRFNDVTTASHNWTLAASGGNVLTLQASSGMPTINVNNQTATISSGLTGTQGFYRTGGGTLAISAASNNLSGLYIFGNGDTRLTSTLSLGPEPAAYVPNAITLTNNATLVNNSSDVTIGATRGLTLGPVGGRLLAGYGRFLTINSVITGAGGLTLRSDITPGPISLNAVNTYTGPTVIGNAVATTSWCWTLVNGSLPAASTVTVNTNGSLGGTGFVHGPVTVKTNGMVGPGGIFQAGTLTINNNLVMTNGALVVDLGNVADVGPENDLLQVNGNVSLKGIITVSATALKDTFAIGTYRLINYTGTGDFTDCTIVSDNPRLGATFDTSILGQVNMTIANPSPVKLTWMGNSGTPYWDVMTSTNFLNGATPTVFYQGDAVTFDDSGVYTDPVTVMTAGANVGMVQPSAVYVTTTNNFTLTSFGTARLGGAMGLYKGGPGTLTLAHGNNSNPNVYSGLTVVSNGTLSLSNGRVLGSTNAPTMVTGLGQLNTGGQSDIYEPVILQGAGPDGSGVVVNTGAATANNGLRGPVTLVGDSTLGGLARWDIYRTALQGNGFKVTKTGINEIAWADLGETGVGDIDVLQGQLTVLGNTYATKPGSRISVVSNAVFAFWGLNNAVETAFVKDVELTDSNFRGNSGTNYHMGTVTLNGTNAVTATGELSLLGPVTGAGSLRKVGTGILALEGANTYSGVTLIDTGTLELGPTATLANSSLISIAMGATLDTWQLANGLLLSPGQTLSGAGTVGGNLAAGPGATIIPGTSPGVLTVAGSLALTNALLQFELGADPLSATSDQILTMGAVASGVNVFKILPLTTLDAVNPYSLIVNSGTPLPSGSETNFSVVTDSRYSFTVLPTDESFGGRVQIKVNGPGVPALLTWFGEDAGSPEIWDLQSTANWLNGATADKFYAGDTVVFDDTAVNTAATLVGALQPAGVLLSNVNKAITIGGAGSLVTPSLSVQASGSTTLANTSGNQFLQGVTNNGGTLVIANSANNDFGSALSLNAGTLVFDQPLDAAVATPLFGSGALLKNNTNTLTLSGASTGPVSITVNNGTLRAGSTTAFGDLATPLTIKPGGSLDVYGQNLSNKVFHVGGAGYANAGAIMNSGVDQAFALQQVVMTADTVWGGPKICDLRGSTTVPASLTTAGDAAFNLTKIGAQRFSIVNTIVGPSLADIEVKDGVLSIEDFTTSLGNPAGTVTVRSNAFLTLYRCAYPIDKVIQLDDGSNVRAGNGTSNFLVGPVLLKEGTIKAAAATSYNVYIDGPVSGPGGIQKLEDGTVSFANSNSFTGDVRVDRGNLIISNSFAIGTNKSARLNYSTAVAGGTGPRILLRGGITTPADVTGVFTAVNFPGDYRCSIASDVLTNTWAGPIVLEGSGIVSFYRNNAGVEFNITGNLYGTNGFTGTAFFRGTAGYGGRVSGKFDMPGGVLALTDNAAFEYSNPANLWKKTQIAFGKFILGTDNAACATAILEFGQSGTSIGVLDLNGFNQTVPAIQYANAVSHLITNGSPTADSVFTFDGGTNNSTFIGRLVDGARNLSFTVNSGSLTLLSNNTHKGSTLINGGTVALGVNGTLASTPLIVLASGATLNSSAKPAGLALGAGQTFTGSGTVEGSLTVGSGATLSVGSSIGAMIITNTLTLATGGTNIVEVNSSAAPSADLVTSGSVTYGGVLVVNNLGPAFAAGNSFTLFAAANHTGAFARIIPETPGAGLRWDTSGLLVDGTLKVAAISMEPTTLSVAFKPGGLDLAWPATHIGWSLQTQTNALTIGLSNNWTTVPGSDSTNAASFLLDTSANSVFFRLVSP